MKIGILGTGSMGRAIAAAIVERGVAEVVAWDVNPEALKGLPAKITVLEPSAWFGTAGGPDAVLVAVKPQDCAAAMCLCLPANSTTPSFLWVSIAAGVTIAALESHAGVGARICRVMPNTPAMVGMGASAYCCNGACCSQDKTLVERLFEACGTVVAVPEKMMNAVTGLSGSGPAYVFLFIEALIEGGVAAGLPAATARELAVQTVRGSAEMLANSSATPGELKARVTSPGGTTSRGLMALEENRFRFAVIEAVIAASSRADELGKS